LEITIIFLLSFFIAVIGVAPPGLLNMTAAKISLKDGHVRGLVFCAGSCVVIAIQTLIATLFARYLSNHPEVISILKRVAFVIFVLITVYFLLVAKKIYNKPKQEREPKNKKSRFFFGIILSALNVFPIPYQAYMVITIASLGWFSFETINIYTYIAGAVTGSFVVFYAYIFFFDKIKSNKLKSQKNMNKLIGLVTGVIALITLINIIREM
jgi:threonine/homoserine/homoserine lactone efflux protein